MNNTTIHSWNSVDCGTLRAIAQPEQPATDNALSLLLFQHSAAMPKFRCFSFDGIDRVEPIDEGEYVLYDDVAAAWPKGTV